MTDELGVALVTIHIMFAGVVILLLKIWGTLERIEKHMAGRNQQGGKNEHKNQDK